MKKEEKKSEVSKDVIEETVERIQKLTDRKIEGLDKLTENKIKEVMSV